jgi:transposase-like protein
MGLVDGWQKQAMRRRFTAEERERFVEEVRAGASVRDAAARRGLNTSLGYRWMQTAGASRGPKFARLVTTATAPPSTITVHVGAATLRVEAGFDADLLRAVVAALSAAPR